MWWVTLAFAVPFTDVSQTSGANANESGSGVAAADFNGDGWLDLLVVSVTGRPHLYFQNANTPLRFQEVSSTHAPGMTRLWDRTAFAADLDDDGDIDVVLTHWWVLSVFLNDGTGRLGTATGADYELVNAYEAGVRGEADHPGAIDGANFEGVDLWDPDGDGRLDLSTTWRGLSISGIGTPSPTWTLGTGGIPSSWENRDYLTVAHFDDDDALDWFSGAQPEAADLYLSGPNGLVPSQQQLALYEKGAQAVCDVDGDGDLDLFRTSLYSTPLPSDSKANQWWMNDGWGTFTSAGNPGLPNAATWGAVCADLDNDARYDLVVNGYFGTMTALTRGNGAAGWSSVATYSGGSVVSVVPADFDRDGDLDLFVSRGAEDRLLRNDQAASNHVAVGLLANVGTCEAPRLVPDYHARFRVAWETLVTPMHTVEPTTSTGITVGGPVHVGLGSIPDDDWVAFDVIPERPSGGEVPAPFRAWRIPAQASRHEVFLRTDDPDGDGIPTSEEAEVDLDQDGLPNHEDWDSDGDQIPDSDEAGDLCSPVDTDNDGLPDIHDTDSDGDGAGDAIDCDRTNPAVGAPRTWFRDADGDGYGTAATTSTGCTAPSGYVGPSGDCDDSSGSIHPGAAELCDAVDRNCDGNATAGATDAIQAWRDLDADGHGDPATMVTTCTVANGFVTNATDCDDQEALAWTGAVEVCDGVDNDCDGTTDLGATDGTPYYPDLDNDGFGAGTPVSACSAPAGHRTNADDCDDSRGSAYPGAVEQCNMLDDDCDGVADEGVVESLWYRDADGDNHGLSTDTQLACSQPVGYAPNPGDCNDLDPAINPLQLDLCDEIDDNCSGDEQDALDAQVWYPDLDGDGAGVQPGTRACHAPPDTSPLVGDCDDDEPLTSPFLPELCDGLDNDCDGTVDLEAFDAIPTWPDMDRDGHGDGSAVPQDACPSTPGRAPNAEDCDDNDDTAHPGGTEVCDGADNDCDGLYDDQDPDLPPGGERDWYPDLDGDGYGVPPSLRMCTPPANTSLLDGDCDDGDPLVSPGALEIPDNGVDDDCDGVDATRAPLDTDGDGLPDAEEADGDFDGDGIPDREDPDSDNDGVLDGAEAPGAVHSDGNTTGPVPPVPDYGCASGPARWSWLGIVGRR